MDNTVNDIYVLNKVGNPYNHGRIVRTEYYVKISFRIDDEKISVTAKIDTGSPYTVIGLGNREMFEYKNRILKNKSSINVYDATDTKLDISEYVVTDFCLTEGLQYDKMKLLFSEDLGEKSIIGMDLLGLYEILYLFEGNTNNRFQGTFKLRRVQYTNKILKSIMQKDDTNILYPASITFLESYSTVKNHQVYNTHENIANQKEVFEVIGKDNQNANKVIRLRNIQTRQVKDYYLPEVIKAIEKNQIEVQNYHTVHKNGKVFLRQNPHI